MKFRCDEGKDVAGGATHQRERKAIFLTINTPTRLNASRIGTPQTTVPSRSADQAGSVYSEGS